MFPFSALVPHPLTWAMPTWQIGLWLTRTQNLGSCGWWQLEAGEIPQIDVDIFEGRIPAPRPSPTCLLFPSTYVAASGSPFNSKSSPTETNLPPEHSQVIPDCPAALAQRSPPSRLPASRCPCQAAHQRSSCANPDQGIEPRAGRPQANQCALLPHRESLQEQGGCRPALPTRQSSLLTQERSQYRVPESFLKPKFNPNYYSDILKELNEAPTRSYFQRVAKRVQGMFRLE